MPVGTCGLCSDTLVSAEAASGQSLGHIPHFTVDCKGSAVGACELRLPVGVDVELLYGTADFGTIRVSASAQQ